MDVRRAPLVILFGLLILAAVSGCNGKPQPKPITITCGQAGQACCAAGSGSEWPPRAAHLFRWSDVSGRPVPKHAVPPARHVASRARRAPRAETSAISVSRAAPAAVRGKRVAPMRRSVRAAKRAPSTANAAVVARRTERAVARIRHVKTRRSSARSPADAEPVEEPGSCAAVAARARSRARSARPAVCVVRAVAKAMPAARPAQHVAAASSVATTASAARSVAV